MERKTLGRWGEERAAAYLRRHGYKILGMNYSCRGGEIDIIAQKRGFVVFAEVKLRKNADFAQAKEFGVGHLAVGSEDVAVGEAEELGQVSVTCLLKMHLSRLYAMRE